MTTTADLIASVRGNTFQVDTTRLPDTLIVAWANEEYTKLRRYLASFAADLFLAISVDLTVTAPASAIDISSLTDLEQIQAVKWYDGVNYRSLKPAGWGPETNAFRKWRQRGFPGAGCVVDIFPARLAPGTYRIEYTTAPTLLDTVTPTGVIKLPPGGPEVLIQAVSARVKAREEEDPSVYESWKSSAYRDLKATLMPKGMVVTDVHGRY